jgi:hypothetical protein
MNTLQQLIDDFRMKAHDTRAPFLWSDAYVTNLANEAQREAVRRARLILDRETAMDTNSNPICTYTVTASQPSIALDPRIIRVERVKIASKTLPLPKARRRDLDLMFPDWENQDPSDTVAYCEDFQKYKLYFRSKFPADDVVSLTVYREPLYDMRLVSTATMTGTATTTIVTAAVDPEIEPRYVDKLVDWMLWRALNDRDIEEKYDPEGAKEHLAIFEGEFGTSVSALQEEWERMHYGDREYEGL